MAQENIQIDNPNFCLGPIAGTFCSVDTSTVSTIVQMKNSTGALLNELFLSSNTVNEFIGMEYVGPKHLNDIYDNLPFFTLEKYSDTTCVISMWRLHKGTSKLNLKKKFTYYDSGNFRYDAISFSAEHHEYILASHAPERHSAFDLSSVSFIKEGTELLIGPSSSSLNYGATEYITVSHIAGKTININESLRYRYLENDPISFCNHIYLFSNVGYGGSQNRGTIYKINARDGKIINYDTDGLYKKVSATRWCTATTSIASILENNVVFIKPYDSYQNWRSMYLGNFIEADLENIPVYDIVFDNYDVYKLMTKTILKNDAGEQEVYEWDKYNFSKTTLLPFTNNISIETDKRSLIGKNERTTLNVKITDQYGVGLRDVNVRFYLDDAEEHDAYAIFDPATAYKVTDINGRTTIDYISGDEYDGITAIRVKADKGSPYSGSEWVWGRVYLKNLISFSPTYYYVHAYKDFLSDRYMSTIKNNESIKFKTYGKSYFSNPYGEVDSLDYRQESLDVKIIQIKNNEFERSIMQENYESCNSSIHAVDESSSMFLSQLKMGSHSHWVDGKHEDDLLTRVALDQFVFVEDAIPKFYSEKNLRNTDIWLRLRPFAYSLDGDSLRFWIRYISGDSDSDFIEKEVSIDYFDAGSSTLGIEVLYENDILFDHNTLVYVHIEVYDTSYSRNFIYIDYWFAVVQDFNLPYLENIIPERESEVDKNVTLSFDIKDEGTGVNIDSLNVYLNSVSIRPDYIEKLSKHHYKFSSFIGDKLLYGRDYIIQVIVEDNSRNRLNYRYRFKTKSSDSNVFLDFYPDICFRGTGRFEDVKLAILNGGSGIDKDTIKLQVFNKDVTNKTKILPIVYRIL